MFGRESTVRFVTLAALTIWSPMAGAPQSSMVQLHPTRIVGLSYPRLALLTGIEGTVELFASVSHEGAVIHIRTGPGPTMLIDAAKEALSRWLFSGCPTSSEPCEFKVMFTFVLAGHSCEIDHCTSSFQVDLPDRVRVTSQPAAAIVN